MRKLKYFLIFFVIFFIIPTIFVVYYLENSIGIKTSLLLSRMFLFTPSEYVSEYDGRTNVLVLGKADELTDTIILVSVPHQKNKPVSIISIPRDIWVEEYQIKINSLNLIGGPLLVQKYIEQMFNIKIQYTLSLGFDDFEKIINLMDGIDVNIEHSFVDDRYPVKGMQDSLCDGDFTYACRYETISFEKGLVKMDGETALKYVRSRKSSDLEEGTDIARSRRQREVINAILSKFFSREVILNSKKVGEVYSTIWSLFETNLSPTSSTILARKIWNNRNYIESLSVPEEFLDVHFNELKYQKLYVFVISEENLELLRKWFYKEILQKEFGFNLK